MVEGKEIEDYDRIFSVGFTFSYGTRQTALNSAYCTNWAKGWETGIQTDDPVTSDKIDLAILLNQAFNRLKIPAKTVAILNDTVGTLVAGSYTKEQYSPDAMIGLIAGTGYNMCYFDPHAHQYNYKGNVINLECGGFDGFLPNNIIDHEVDDATAPHGLQRFEKMVAGLYIPELARRLILRVFRSKAPKLCWCHDSITTKAVFKIMEDETPDLAVVKNAVATLFEWDTNTLSLTELNAIKQICKTVIVRSSTMIAAAIAAVASLTGRLSPASGGLTIAVDGSIYTKNKSYRDLLSAKLVDILGPNLARLIKFHISSDGSGIGAAILAATANKIVLRNC
ncbi:hexokinase-like [Dermatophagoides farinae]|uniref:hexokinase-like n=1 Tax=Dermatophagoides farinae TaxID=6954 RepID=UPI003F5D6A9A